jgi:chemotaxis methyl-accepting protein methylase
MVVCQTGKYRHIVFADALNGAARVIDFCAAELPYSHEIAAAADLPATLSDEERAFVHWLFRQAGLSAGNYREETLRRRLAACLRAVRASSLAAARVILQRNAELVPIAINAMLIGVTSFYRDPAVFERLREQVLPTLLARAVGGPMRPLRVWSIGCADGAELYSVAMLLDDAGALEGSELLGTDCRPEAIRRARIASYDFDALRSLPEPLRARYFVAERASGRYHVRRELCDDARWRVADILAAHEPGLWDLILCRNVAMYMRSAVLGALWARLGASLAPGGVLVLGKAERPIGLRRLAAIAPCIYRRN